MPHFGILEVAATIASPGHTTIREARLLGSMASFGLAAVLLILLLFISLSSWPRQLEQATGLNWLFQWRGAITPPSELAIITMDYSVAERLGYPKQPIRWSRQAYADLLKVLTQAGAAMVVFDIAFQESRQHEDQALAQAITEHGSVVLFKYLEREQVSIKQNADARIDIEREILPPTPLLQSARATSSFTLPKFPSRVVHTALFSELSQGLEPTQPMMAYLIYHQDLLPALIRLVKTAAPVPEMLEIDASDPIEIFALNLKKALLQDHNFARRVQRAHALLNPDSHLYKLLCAIQHDERMYLNFYGPAATLKHIPMHEPLLAPQDFINSGKVKNKVVYIGFAEDGPTEQRDAHHTAFTLDSGVDLSGVEISATTFANLLNNEIIQSPAWYWQSLILMSFFVLPVAIFFCLPLRWALAAVALVFAGYSLLAQQLFSLIRLWLPLLSPLLIVIVAAVVALTSKISASKKRQQHVQGALARYLPADIAETLSFNIDKLENQHRLVQGICLMTDIHGYSRVSETLAASELHEKLNAYYARLIDVVNAHGGSVSNIVGDSLLAIWTNDKIDAALCTTAVQAAKDILATLETESGEQEFPTSIALHCGEFSLGHLGAKNHFEFSPVGDIVNTTSRIEHLNRDLNTHILASENFAHFLPAETIGYRGQFEVHSKKKPVRVYEVLGFEN